MKKLRSFLLAFVVAGLVVFLGHREPLWASVVVDNADVPGFTVAGTWGTNTTDPKWGADYRSHETGTGTNTATWSADLTAGNYNVYAWWVTGDNRATNAPYTINYDGASDTVRVCQETCNGKWVYLGNYYFDGSSSVALSDDADEYVIADAIRFKPGVADNPYPIIDTSHIRFSGTDWHGSATSGYNSDIAWHAAGTGTNTVTWTTDIPEAGTYNVYAWWTPYSNRATNAPYTINYEGGSETVRVCQELGGDQWVYLGNYPFGVGAYSVVLSDDADEYVMADAIKFEPGAPDNPYPIVDTPYIRFQGSDWHGNTTAGYNNDSASHVAGTGSNTATWTTHIPAPGNYNVFVWWTAYSNRATNAPYTIFYEGGSETVRVCQEISGSQWIYLGNYYFDAGSYSVVLSDAADEYVYADAIKFEPGTPDNPYPVADTNHIRFEGSGWHGVATTGYNEEFAYHTAGTGINAATWTTNISLPGNHNVWAWWKASTDRATNAPFTIYHDGAPETIYVNQKENGGQWVLLGNYDFSEGTFSVVLRDNANGLVVADAIWWDNTGDNEAGGLGDGMRDGWELYYGLDPYTDDAALDEDSDGLDNLGEYTNGTDPTEPDSDADNLEDGGEIANGTDPFDPDTDGDGLSDGWEVAHGFNPLVDDSDLARIWDNDSADGLWSTPANWSGDTLPQAGDVVVFNETSTDDCTGDSVANNLLHILLDFGYGGTLTIEANAIAGSNALTLAGDLTLNSGTIVCEGDPSAINEASGGTAEDPHGEGMLIQASNIFVGSGAMIHADGQGFAPDAGPGNPEHSTSRSAGGSYGGRGTFGAYYRPAATYGSVDQPTALGSGGGGVNAGRGGGAIKLAATNTLTADGTISARGTQGAYDYAGGSGGSLWLVCNSLVGQGVIRADGGAYGGANGGGGGGGRIALAWTSGNRSFSGTISAAGAIGYRSEYGLPGTLHVGGGLWNELWNDTYPVNGSVALAPGTYNITTLHVTDDAVLSCQGDAGDGPVTDNPDGTFTGDWGTSSYAPGYYGDDYHYHEPGAGTDTFTWTLTVTTPGTYEVFARWTQDPSRAPDATYTVYHDGGSTPVSVDQRSSGGTWVFLGSYALDGSGDYVELTQSPNGYVIADAVMTALPDRGVILVSDNVTIDTGAMISADGEGFGADAGPGTPGYASNRSAGGSYGGMGSFGSNYRPAATYGSAEQPTALGSGGGGMHSGRGGGALKLTVTNTLTVNGAISVNGTVGLYDYAGGSGGSIWIACNTLAGDGAIRADGGAYGGANGGGGGGGRISLAWASGNRTFSGTISAAGAAGYRSEYGQPGTIYVPGGLWNELWNDTYPVNGSVALAPGTYNITTLYVTNNATLACQGDNDGDPPEGAGVIIVSDNITIDTGAKISADGEGFAADAGPGNPGHSSNRSAGGSYGGMGGAGTVSAAAPTYGLLYEPAALGSGGGGFHAGRGGGAIKLVVADTLTVDGLISANGTQGLYDYAGGSGGSLWLVCGTLAGDGTIRADGGAYGGANGGGGGGGRVHVSRTTWAYTGFMTVFLAMGYNNGEDGTLYYDNPFLEWAGEGNYQTDGLDPEWGKATLTTFTYRVSYRHLYDKAPSAGYPKVHIFKDGAEITGSPFSLTAVDPGDTQYDDGKLYDYATVFDIKGNYTYYFAAESPSCGPGMGEGTAEIEAPSVVPLLVAQNQRTGTWYEEIQPALDAAESGDTVQVETGLTYHEPTTIIIPAGVTLTGDTDYPADTTIKTTDLLPVVALETGSAGSALKGLAVKSTAENLTRDVPGRKYYIDIGDGSSNITIEKCLIGRDDYVSGWSGTDSRFLATTTYNDGGIRTGENASNITIASCKIRYLTGPGIAVEDGSHDGIVISNNHIYGNILPYDLRTGDTTWAHAPGIGLVGTARADIIANKIYENNVGIGSHDLTGTDGTEGTLLIESNIIHHNNRAGIGLNTQSNTYFKSTDIAGNEIYSNGGGQYMGGVRIRYAYDLKLRQNHIHDNLRMGAYLDRVYDFQIYNNYIYRNYWNVRLEYVGISQTDQSFVYKNIIDAMGNVRGLLLTAGSNITLSSNIIQNADRWGLYFSNQSGPIDLRHNRVSDNGRPGLRAHGAFSGNLFKNLFVNNHRAGIRFWPDASGDLQIYNNTIADSTWAGLEFAGGLTTSTYCLFHNIFAFNGRAGYKYGGDTWPDTDRWDWVDKHDNFFFWNYSSKVAGNPDSRERLNFLYAQWGGRGGNGVDDITMSVAHLNLDEEAWNFSNDPDDPYSLDPADTTGLLQLSDGLWPGGAYSAYEGRSATYTEPDPPTRSPADSYEEPPAVEPPDVAEVPEPFPG